MAVGTPLLSSWTISTSPSSSGGTRFSNGCIPYSAAAVARYHGADVDPLQLLRSVPVTKAGVAYADVAAELVKKGLRAEIIHPSVAELRVLLGRGLPVVVGQSRSVRADHALVAIRHDPARAVYAVMDPAQPGLRDLPAADLEPAFEAAGRRALLIQPGTP